MLLSFYIHRQLTLDKIFPDQFLTLDCYSFQSSFLRLLQYVSMQFMVNFEERYFQICYLFPLIAFHDSISYCLLSLHRDFPYNCQIINEAYFTLFDTFYFRNTILHCFLINCVHVCEGTYVYIVRFNINLYKV